METPKRLKNFIGSYKPSMSATTFQTQDLSDLDAAFIVAEKQYWSTLRYNRRIINEAMIPLYGKPLFFRDRMTGDILIRVKKLKEATGKSLGEIGQDLKDYLGYPCSFFRQEASGRKIPVDSERILNAYTAMKENKAISEIENILYN